MLLRISHGVVYISNLLFFSRMNVFYCVDIPQTVYYSPLLIDTWVVSNLGTIIQKAGLLRWR